MPPVACGGSPFLVVPRRSLEPKLWNRGRLWCRLGGSDLLKDCGDTLVVCTDASHFSDTSQVLMTSASVFQDFHLQHLLWLQAAVYKNRLLIDKDIRGIRRFFIRVSTCEQLITLRCDICFSMFPNCRQSTRSSTRAWGSDVQTAILHKMYLQQLVLPKVGGYGPIWPHQHLPQTCVTWWDSLERLWWPTKSPAASILTMIHKPSRYPTDKKSSTCTLW